MDRKEQHRRNEIVFEWLIDHAPGHYCSEISEMILKEFGWEYSRSQLLALMNNFGKRRGIRIHTGMKGCPQGDHYKLQVTKQMQEFIIKNRYVYNNGEMYQHLKQFPKGDRLTYKAMVCWRRKHHQTYRKYTPEFHEFVKAHVTMDYNELAKLCTEKFGIPITREGMTAFISYNHYSFRHWKRTISPRQKPVGTERIRASHKGEASYWEVKVADPNVWRSKAEVMWERYHQEELPADHVVLFLDKNRENFAEENLRAVPRKIMGRLNLSYKLTEGDANLSNLAINLAHLNVLLNENNKEDEPVGGGV